MLHSKQAEKAYKAVKIPIRHYCADLFGVRVNWWILYKTNLNLFGFEERKNTTCSLGYKKFIYYSQVQIGV